MMRECALLIPRGQTASEEERFLDLSRNDSDRPQLLVGLIYGEFRDKNKLVMEGNLKRESKSHYCDNN